MPCEHYQDALVEAAASGTAPQGELRAHLAGCAACHIAFAQEQSVFSSMDEGLRVAANAEVPASLLVRVRARLADEPAPIRSWRFPSLVLAGAAVMVVALLVAHTVWHTHIELPPSNNASNSTTPSTMREQEQAQTSNPASPVSGNSIAHPRVTGTRVPTRPSFSAARESVPEVLVPPDQEVLLVNYAEQWRERKRLPLVATNFDATNLSPLQIAPIQIAQLDVKLMAEEQGQ
jgi:hypothetical protein